MASQIGGTNQAEENAGASGLEGHLRNLILSNSPARPSIGNQQLDQNQQITSDATQRKIAAPPGFSVLQGHSAAQPDLVQENIGGAVQPKSTGRKRPNQAQRRHMSSQLSIPIGTQQSHKSNWRAYDQSLGHGNGPHHLQRHQHTMSHLYRGPDYSRSRQTQGYGLWNSPEHTPNVNNHGGPAQSYQSGPSEHHPRHNPSMSLGYRRQAFTQEEIIRQSALLEEMCFFVLASSEIERSDIAEKEAFRQKIESICRQIISQHEWHEGTNPEFSPNSVELKCFGSLSSGFATKASDMDLGLISPLSVIQPDAHGSTIPRLIEKAFLDAGIGARLLSRTRVPIIKMCETPPAELLRDLLAQRERWENGLDQDHAESNDEEEQASDLKVEANDDERTQASEDLGASSNSFSFQLPDEQGELQSYHLKQASKHNLPAYFGLAKRVLRKAGGRDATMSNARDFSQRDWEVLNGVCKALICGLADPSLRETLSKYPSLTFATNSAFPNYRTLLGTSIQVEGAQIMRLWENWPIAGQLLVAEPTIEKFLTSWYELQWRQSFGQDPLSYTKELQVALDKIQKMPAFQLLLLEQGPRETVPQYCHRTKAITKHIRAAAEWQTREIQREIVQKYISGINHDGVRQELIEWQSTSLEGNLDVIACKHRALNLAAELERALKKKKYYEAQAEDVRRYIDLLHRPLQRVTNYQGKEILVVPIDDELVQLVTTIKTLPDPHKMAPNQPRDRYKDPLEFPKDGAGVQCDINFSAHLALQNTLLLRCYSHTDPRVRPMILFVKQWAKVRGINSGYRGTLSSYGYVLMVLHYLVNVASPFVCPNLQQAPPSGPDGPQICRGYNVEFWRNEAEIIHLARSNQINHNSQSLGYLLRGFFEYFAQNGPLSVVPGRGFDWGRDVLSLRTHGGILTKQDKGWTGAKTVYQVQGPNEPLMKATANLPDGQSSRGQERIATTAAKSTALNEVRLRYLFAIEDPFELDHNVARTVTHNGIVSIRDEFRRAWRIIQAAGHGLPHDDLLQDVNNDESVDSFSQLIDEIHGIAVV